MKFTELEQIMSQRGINSLADIARALKTTPQAVSNWKARNQIPYRIVTIINQISDKEEDRNALLNSIVPSPTIDTEKPYDYTALLFTIFNNLRTVIVVPTIVMLATAFYLFIIADVSYISTASILPTGSGDNSISGINALASDFGISLGSNQTDFSSSDMFTVILKSRTLAKNVVYAKLNSDYYGEKNSLFKIITEGITHLGIDKQEIVAIEQFQRDLFSYSEDRKSALVTISVRTFSPKLSADLAKIIISESNKMQTNYKIEKVAEKRKFIEERIKSVESELTENELLLKKFRENNRQINNSPSLLLEQERLERETEVITNIFITLKQQYEMVKIEAVEKSTMLQILDHPKISPYHDERRTLITLFSGIIGFLFGFVLVLIKHSLDARKKRKIIMLKKALVKNIIDLILFRRK